MKHQRYLLHVVYTFFAMGITRTFASRPSSNETSDWIENIIPASYIKIHNPTFHSWRKNITETTEVIFLFTPRHVLSVEPKKMEFTVDLELTVVWKDDRLIIPGEFRNEKSINIDVPNEEAVKLWTPHVFLENCKACNNFLTDPGTQRVQLYGNEIIIKIEDTYRFTCAIELQNYPFDVQHCKIRVEKREHIIEVPFAKRYIHNKQHDDINVPPEYVLTGITWKNCTEHEYMECIEYVFRFRRMIANHVMLVFIPSLMVVIMSWISFWLDVEVAGPRVALGLTSLLTLATQLNNSQHDLPPVSAIKAIDIWMFGCMFMVFSSLIEFAIANFWARRKKNKAKVAPIPQVTLTRVSQLENLPRRNTGNQFMFKNNWPTSRIDFVARIAFPTVYIIFNVVFWGYFTTKEK